LDSFRSLVLERQASRPHVKAKSYSRRAS